MHDHTHCDQLAAARRVGDTGRVEYLTTHPTTEQIASDR